MNIFYNLGALFVFLKGIAPPFLKDRNFPSHKIKFIPLWGLQRETTLFFMNLTKRNNIDTYLLGIYVEDKVHSNGVHSSEKNLLSRKQILFYKTKLIT